MYDVGLADRLRKRGVVVVEVGGWKTRGSSSFSPRGAVNHHTAGSAVGVAPSLNLCIYGRGRPGQPGYLPGPLCQVLLGRDRRAYVIAAGRANHAGKGGWQGLSGNSSVHGLEIEHTGYGPSPEQLLVAVKIHAAFLEAPGSTKKASFVCQHFEWAPTRKIDFRELTPPFTPSTFREAIDFELKPPPDPTPTPEDEDVIIEFNTPGKVLRAVVDGVVMGWKSETDRAAFINAARAAGVKVFRVSFTEKGYDHFTESFPTGPDVNEVSAKVDQILAILKSS